MLTESISPRALLRYMQSCWERTKNLDYCRAIYMEHRQYGDEVTFLKIMARIS